MKILSSVSDVINALPNNVLSYDDFNKVVNEYGCEIRNITDYDTCTFYGDNYCFEYRHINMLYVKGTDINAWSVKALDHISKDNQLGLLSYTLDKFFIVDSNIYAV